MAGGVYGDGATDAGGGVLVQRLVVEHIGDFSECVVDPGVLDLAVGSVGDAADLVAGIGEGEHQITKVVLDGGGLAVGVDLEADLDVGRSP